MILAPILLVSEEFHTVPKTDCLHYILYDRSWFEPVLKPNPVLWHCFSSYQRLIKDDALYCEFPSLTATTAMHVKFFILCPTLSATHLWLLFEIKLNIKQMHRHMNLYPYFIRWKILSTRIFSQLINKAHLTFLLVWIKENAFYVYYLYICNHSIFMIFAQIHFVTGW